MVFGKLFERQRVFADITAQATEVRGLEEREARESILWYFCRRKSAPTCGRGSPRHVRTIKANG